MAFNLSWGQNFGAIELLKLKQHIFLKFASTAYSLPVRFTNHTRGKIITSRDSKLSRYLPPLKCGFQTTDSVSRPLLTFRTLLWPAGRTREEFSWLSVRRRRRRALSFTSGTSAGRYRATTTTCCECRSSDGVRADTTQRTSGMHRECSPGTASHSRGTRLARRTKIRFS